MPRASSATKDARHGPDPEWVAEEVEGILRLQQAKTAFITRQGDHELIGSDERRFTLRAVTGSAPENDPDHVFSVAELVTADLPPRTSVVDGLIDEGTTVLLAGRLKVGKSLLAQQLGLRLATGTPFLGMPVGRTRRVLLIDLENGLHDLQSRFRRMQERVAG